MGRVAGCSLSLPMGLWKKKKKILGVLLSHFGSSLQSYGVREWTVLQNLKKRNKTNFNRNSDNWVEGFGFVLLEKPTIRIPKRCREESGLSPSWDCEPKQISP